MAAQSTHAKNLTPPCQFVVSAGMKSLYAGLMFFGLILSNLAKLSKNPFE
jgi:hypothetical protein